MNSAIRTTLLMLIVAIASVFAAMYYYPWPEFAVIDAEVGKPLFDEYSVDKVRGINILEFDSDKGSMERIRLSRRAERWVIPARQDFIASESRRIGVVINSLNDRTVYQVISENQEDHIKFGVVEPGEIGAEMNVDSLGKKITLTDRNNKTIADLIIGAAVKNDSTKRYVRKPGKPRVYTIDYDPRILTAEFGLWVSTNVLGLQLPGQESGQQIRQIEIDNYKITANENQNPEKSSVYRAILEPLAGELNIKSLLIPENKKWRKLNTTPEQQVKLTNVIRPLVLFFTDDIRAKDKELAAALKKPSKNVPDQAFESLASYGFFKRELNNGRWSIDSVNGEVSVASDDGVITTISIGRPGGGANSADQSKLNYFVMINSGVDYRFLQEPVRPPKLKDDESDENKGFLREVQAWKSAESKAKRLADEMNLIHGDWFYLVSEDIIKTLKPEINLPTINTNSNSDGESQPNATEPKSESDNQVEQTQSEPDGQSDRTDTELTDKSGI